MGQITVFSGPERQRRWSEDEGRVILAEAFSPGACVGQVARRHDVSTALVYTWRRKLLKTAAGPDTSTVHNPGFAETTIVDEGEGLSAARTPAMIMDLARGKRVSIFASASPALVGAALKALRGTVRATVPDSDQARSRVGQGALSDQIAQPVVDG
ncbi:IS66-like element accessory protein TnpA [Altericroceibacterium xinjiangense]|uniref:IS66-like element accessory protein TnpA n=1 Tax=Altericroceibacterium xinjiangense TaxID=762261 RepID=UPI000F7F92B1|nr:transposase [Altericroceibacterium xinjiangense]